MLSITISDDNDVSYDASGGYVTMIDQFALFEMTNGHFYLRLPSGYLAPCFCPGFVPRVQDAASAEQRVYADWRRQRLQKLIDFVQENAGSTDDEIISIMGALQIPHARREIAELQNAADEKTRDVARKYAEVSREIAKQVCP
jgi:hypothetical protein